ncbi:MAG TPA: NAD(P)H-dependent oxidoreductase subunit E [Planctomycetota bacterium]|nr:NAD(P)H-dependent oxidoreductase subunit E [Planctomycetota bacterium]
MARTELRLCHGPSCRLAGSGQITRRLEQSLGITVGESTKDDSVSLSSLPCLGACGNHALISVNGAVATAPQADEIELFLQRIASGDVVDSAPDVEVVSSNVPAGTPSLLDFVRSEQSQSALQLDHPQLAAKLRLTPSPRTVIVNAHRGVPGDQGERLLLERAPRQVIAAAAELARKIGARQLAFMIPAQFVGAADALRRAIQSPPRRHVQIKVLSEQPAFILSEGSVAREVLAGRPAMPVPEILLTPDDALVVGVQELLRYAGFSSRLVSLNSGFARPGVYEFTGETTWDEVVARCALRPGAVALHLGGAMGRMLKRGDWNHTVGESYSGNSSALLIFEEQIETYTLTVTEFCALENCGKCVPCREGSYRLMQGDTRNRRELVEALELASLCRLGQATGEAIRSLSI